MNKQYVPNIKDSYALITGGTQGLGLLYVKELLTIGYDVIVVSPHELKIESLKTQFPNRKIVYLKRDLCSLKQCEITFYECNKFNISLIINNSGIGV
jgi:short-subunit dehydrogenase